jgi:F0F1-type ATP synthase assembly protein I
MANNKNQVNKWLALINIPIQMGIVIFVFSYFGKWLDEEFETNNSVFLIIFSLFSVCIAFYNVIRQVKNINRNDK